MAQGRDITEDASLEMVKRQPVVTHSLTANEHTSEDDERYSSLRQLLRVTAYVIFIRHARRAMIDKVEIRTSSLESH